MCIRDSCYTGRRHHNNLQCRKPCQGACRKEEEPSLYNQRVVEAIDVLQRPFEEDFLILDKGRHEEEYSVITVFEGQVKGLGFIERGEVRSQEDLLNAVSPIKHLPASEYLIKDYLRHSKTAKKLSMRRAR